MEKKALISVKSFSDIDPNDAVEVVTPGSFIINGDSFEAIYEESKISGMEGTTTKIKIDGDSMMLIREGTTNTTMEFSEGYMSPCLYNTPYGMLDLSVDTKKLELKVDENGGEIYSKYILGFAGQEEITTELHVKITIS